MLTDIDLPPGVTKINSSLYQLYAPPGPGQSEVDIIFFHGLQLGDYRAAYYDTWFNGNVCWPQTFLGEQTLINARIFSISYDSSARKTNAEGYGDVYTIAENLVADIIDNKEVAMGRLCPVILVGHSLGGLVIKKILLMTCEIKCSSDPQQPQDLEKITRYDDFIRQVRGVFYYATPHQGSILADRALWLPGNSQVLQFLKTLSNDTARLNDHFRKFRSKHNIQASTIAESLPTRRFFAFWRLFPVSAIVVVEASARFDTFDHYTSTTADHITVCKPPDMNDNRFSKLREFIKGNMPQGQQLTDARNAEAAELSLQ
ncbi:unnamed protein product [Calypogeia fissa]